MSETTIHTRLCELAGIVHPIVQAGMAREGTNADLVIAVSAAGGLGTLGCLDRPAEEAAEQIAAIRRATNRPFGVNFVLDFLDEAAFEVCLAARVPFFTFFRGDPAAAVARAHEAGALTIYQATTVDEAERAVRAGVDALIAQGSEAGGHMGYVPLTALLPAVVEIARPRPVLAAGGIVDGRGLAAALCLGASGVLMGTRFLATPESPILPAHKKAILEAPIGATVASGLFDLIGGSEWPGVRVRGLRNPLTERWDGRQDELRRVRERVLAEVQQAEQNDDATGMMLLAGEGAGLIRELLPAGEVVRSVVREAVSILRELALQLSDRP